ncbi:MAG: hypothetical protein KDD56_04560 [Bdellovibrionales bacterium]|nr:hypothetical protein [Bdellovibrionales bacterium]
MRSNDPSLNRIEQVASDLSGETFATPRDAARSKLLACAAVVASFLSQFGGAALKTGAVIGGGAALTACGGGGTNNVRTPAVSIKTPEEIAEALGITDDKWGADVQDTGITNLVEIAAQISGINVEDFFVLNQTSEDPYSVSSVNWDGGTAPSQGEPVKAQIITAEGNFEETIYESSTSSPDAILYKENNSIKFDREKFEAKYGVDSTMTITKLRLRPVVNLDFGPTGEIITMFGPSLLIEITPEMVQAKVIPVNSINPETGEVVKSDLQASEAMIPSGNFSFSFRVLSPEENAAFDLEFAANYSGNK